MDNAAWDFGCLDWVERLRDGRSLLPDLPLDPVLAKRAVAIFDRLRLPDVVGQPPMEEAAGEWFRDILRATFGSLNEAGERQVREVFALVPKKNSKALKLDTPIATPSGFTTMGTVKVGDLVLDCEGKPTRVREKSPVFIGRPCFEVEFSTGERVTCDAEHLWVTDAHLDRQRQARHLRAISSPSVKTTAEIAETLKVKSGRYVINNHRIALCGALDLPEVALPIPPYALGVWLGNGAAEGSTVTMWSEEVDEMAARLTACGQPAYVRARYPEKGSATIAMTTPGAAPSARLAYRFTTAARTLGLLRNKHIPQPYLRASKEQRLELLQGLMDTDGHISRAGQASFTTTTPALRDGVAELVASLGYKPSVDTWVPKLNGKDCAQAWRVSFFPFADVPVFKIDRKRRRQKQRPDRVARSESRQIVAVRPVASVPTQCIGVESPTRQFLVTKSLIPTHNTTGGAGVMITALLMNQRPNAEFLLVGPTQEIADLAFAQASGMIEADPEGYLAKRFHVAEHKKTITDRRNGAFLKIKTFDMKVMTGSKPAGVLLDELHIMSSYSYASRVLGQIRGGMIANPDAFLIIITTQSDQPPTGVFRSELQYARGVRDGRVKSARTLPILYEFPEAMQRGDKAEWRDTANWPMVLPNLGLSITLDRLIADYETAVEKGEEEERRWASQHLNVEIGMALHSERWRGADYWLGSADDEGLSLKQLLERSEVAVVGVDGGGLDDLLGLAVLGRDRMTKRWLLWAHAWCQSGVLTLRKEIASTLEDFEAAGDLTICRGDVTQDIREAAEIVAQVRDAGLLPETAAVGLDPVGVSAMIDELAGHKIGGDQVVGITQGFRLAPAVWGMERKLADGTLRHAGQGLMAWAVGNAKAEQKGNAVLITKETAGKSKIDPLIAAFNAFMLMSRNPEVNGKVISGYEARAAQRRQEAAA